MSRNGSVAADSCLLLARFHQVLAAFHMYTTTEDRLRFILELNVCTQGGMVLNFTAMTGGYTWQYS
jgi:hypothetical protein